MLRSCGGCSCSWRRGLAPTLAPFLGKIINALLGMVLLITQGQFSMDNWSALMNAQYAAIAAPIDVQDPNSSSMQLLTLALFGMISYIGFHTALKKAGNKDPIISSLFGALGAMVVGYIITRFVLDRIFSFPETQYVEIAQSEFPPISINATLLVAMVLVLVVYGILHRRSRPPRRIKPISHGRNTATVCSFLIVVMGIIGMVRGFLKELGVTLVLIATLFALDRLIPIINGFINNGGFGFLGLGAGSGNAKHG